MRVMKGYAGLLVTRAIDDSTGRQENQSWSSRRLAHERKTPRRPQLMAPRSGRITTERAGRAVITNVNDWVSEEGSRKQWSPPRTELGSRIRPGPVAYRCQQADAWKPVRRRYMRND